MANVVCIGGKQKLLSWMFHGTSDNLTLHLYQNNYTPAHDSNTENFTECTFVGYSSKTITKSEWTDPVLTIDNKAQTTYALQSWSVGSTQNVYGVYFTNGGGDLIFAEKFDTMITVGNLDTVTYTPLFELS